MKLQLKLLDPGLPVPECHHEHDAGVDLRARVDATLSSAVGPVVVPTGVSVWVPPGHVALVCPRSGLAARQGIGVLNAPGVIDPGYTGEIKVVLHTVTPQAQTVRRGDRVAQLILCASRLDLEIVEELPNSDRGSAGFGSTGR